MLRTHDKTNAFVALPVMLAVLLVALCMPLTCAGAAAPAKRVPAPVAVAVPEKAMLADALMHGGGQSDARAMHHPAPAEKPSPRPADSDDCKHTIPTTVQASANEQQQIRALDVAAPVIVPVPAPAVALAVLVDERPSDPPGVTLNASHLRV